MGIDRGVRTALVTSAGQHYRAPRISDRDAGRYLALQRRHARQKPGSRRREKTRRKMAALTAKVTGRRKDWAEKVSTRLAAGHGLVVFEQLNTPGMVRKPKPKPAPEREGAWLPNRARAKAGLNKGILASARGALAARTRQKAAASGVTVVFADARYTSRQRRACGHGDHADANAARNILARGLALILHGEAVPARNPGHGNKRPHKTRPAAAGPGADTARNEAA